MSLADLSIKRPIFITCLVVLMLVMGFLSYKKMPVDQFPDVTFPVVSVYVQYNGASPVDMEKQVAKVIEDQLSSLSGLDTLTSNNYDSATIIILKFRLGTDIKDAEQQVRNRVGNVRNKLPQDAMEPVIRRFDPADQPILTLAVESSLNAGDLYDLADEQVKPLFERIPDVGQVLLIGGRKKEVQVLVNKQKLDSRKLSMVQVAKRVEETSKDIPIGKVEDPRKEVVYRSTGEFSNIKDIKDVSVSFLGSDRAVKLNEIADVKMDLETQTRISTINGKTALFLDIYKQSGTNTVAVADRVKAAVEKVNQVMEEKKLDAKVGLIRDGSVPIRLNVADVRESIIIGILLCVVVVFFFLGSARSTFITGMALPNSLLGGFVLMFIMGFSINIMTLLALSLAVGLLIDDAIVVRENIFRHMEMGKPPIQAATEGTKEVAMAVIATTFVVISVFGPVAFVPGIVGQFFKQFGLTVVFTMLISLFDAFTVAPMLSAYMATGTEHHKDGKGFMDRVLRAFDRFQTKLEDIYESSLRWTIQHKKTVLASAFGIFIFSIVLVGFIPKTFLPPNEIGEFLVQVEMPTGSSLEGTYKFAQEMEKKIRATEGVELVTLNVGTQQFESNKASFYVHLVPRKQRKLSTSQTKTLMRENLKEFTEKATVAVSDFDISGGGQKPLNLYLVGDNLDTLANYALTLQTRIAKIPGLADVDTNFRAGKPEFHVNFNRDRSEELGVSTTQAGLELRYRTEGAEAAVYRENGIEYKVRVKFDEAYKDLKKYFNQTSVPNQNFNMVPLEKVAVGEETTGYSQINRQNKGRFIAITANLGPGGQLGNATDEIVRIIKNEVKPPPGIDYRFEGQAQDFQDLMANMMIAMGLGVLLIYLVLSSLYESFVTPIVILLALPLAISGAMGGLFITGKTIDIFSIIGLILLMGVVAKNSILLVDYALHLMKEENASEDEALIKSGRTRLRPILMTSLALIAGTLPIAAGLTELGSQRQSMGIAIIGGVLSSTLLTLLVVPAAFGYVERFRRFSQRMVTKFRGVDAAKVAHGK